MSNKSAVLTCTLKYKDANNVTQRVDGSALQISAPYQALGVGAVDVPDTTVDDTEYSIPFGSIGVGATLAMLQNKTGQDLEVKINEPTHASGTLVSGTKDITLANVAGDRLVVLLNASGGTPGVLSVKRKSDSEVTVQSWVDGVGIQASDTSTVDVYNYGPGGYMQLVPDEGIVIAQCAADNPGSKPVLSMKAKTTATQSGDGEIAYYLFGDPV